MSEGNITAALKLLDSSSSSGLLPLTKEVMDELKEKHPQPEAARLDALLKGPIQDVPECLFDSIDEHAILKSAKETKGSGGPSAVDAEQFRRIVCSKNFLKQGKVFREELADLAKNLATKLYEPLLLEAYVACRLIPLDKDPGIRPIGVGEVLRRIIGKTISRVAKSQIREAAGPLQTCASHGAGAEAAIHAMRIIFQQEGTDGVLLIDASNAFNCMNRSVALYNVQITCPIIATYLINTYRQPAVLFISGGKRLESTEGTTQGDPLAMAWYSLTTVTLIDILRCKVPTVKQVWLADDASAAGKISALKEWYDVLIEEGRKFGYYVNQSKSWIILKNETLKIKADEIFANTINTTSDGKRHLGAVIGSNDYGKSYCEEKVKKWIDELQVLCDVAETHPQMAYAAYAKGYKSKFTYFLRTIEGMEDCILPVDNVISEQLIPTLFGTDISPELRDTFSLNVADGGLGIQVLSEEAKEQFEASVNVTKPHVESILDQASAIKTVCQNGVTRDEIAKALKKKKSEIKEDKLRKADEQLPLTAKHVIEQTRDKGASSWLNALPIEDMDFSLNKEEFQDALRLRYNIKLENLPSKCFCGDSFNINHALTCKKGGFIAERHDNIKNILTKLLCKVGKGVESEPHLLGLTGETFDLRTANTADEARLDIKAPGFWQRGQTAYFDVRVTHVNNKAQQGQSTSKTFKQHEQAKKREYLQRILEVDNGSFTPLVFGTNGGLGEECARFLSALSNKISKKEDESYASIITWVRTRLSFEIVRSSIACIRGARGPFRARQEEIRDFDLMTERGGLN